MNIALANDERNNKLTEFPAKLLDYFLWSNKSTSTPKSKE